MKSNLTLKTYLIHEHGNDPLYENFRQSYCDLNDLEIEDFNRLACENFERIGREKLRQTIDSLSKAIKEAQSFLAQNGFQTPGIIVFTGPGLMDGHAVEIDGEIYVFFDLSLISKHYQNKNFEKLTHALHEICHGVHYHKSPDFERRASFKRRGEYAFRMLISEGVACALSSQLLSKQHVSHDPFWFGLLSPDVVKEWKKCCESRIEDDLEEILTLINGESPKEELFSVLSFDRNDLIRGRRAYFLGYHLVKKSFQKEEGIEDLLKKDPHFWGEFCGSKNITGSGIRCQKTCED